MKQKSKNDGKHSIKPANATVLTTAQGRIFWKKFKLKILPWVAKFLWEKHYNVHGEDKRRQKGIKNSELLNAWVFLGVFFGVDDHCYAFTVCRKQSKNLSGSSYF